MDLYRHLLRLYPKSFRNEYGEEMRGLHHDLRVHGGVRGFRLFTSTVGDVVRSAPKLRLEEGMAAHPGRTRGVITIFVAVTFLGLAALGPLMGIPLLIGLVFYMRAHRHDVATAGSSASLWIGMPMTGAILLLIGAAAALLASDESAWWPLVVGPFIIGAPMVLVSLVLMAVHELGVRVLHRPELVGGRTRAVSAGLALTTLAVLLLAMGEDRGWGFFMMILLTIITLGVLGAYALLLRFTRPKPAPVV